MKSLVIIPIFLGLAACGENAASHSSSVNPLHSIGHGLVLSQDLRPVDGNLTEVIIRRTPNGSYTAQLHTLTSGFVVPPVDKVEDLGFGLSCFATKRGELIKTVMCSRDDRPVDGVLIDLTASINSSGTYDVTLLREYMNRVTGKVVRETRNIADHLALENPQF